jgi:integrase/recombinase XerD
MPRNPRPPVPAWPRPWLTSWTLALRAGGRSARTIANYSDALAFLAGWLHQHRPDVTDWADVDRDALRAFWAWLYDQGYAKGYVNNLARALQQFFRWYADEEQRPNPFTGMAAPPAPKPGEKLVPVLTAEQLGALIRDAERGRDFESRRDAAILRLLACAGVRLAELAYLQDSDLNLPGREAVVTGKGSRQRTVKIDHKAALAVDRYLRLRARHKAVTDHGATALWIGARRRTGMTPSGIYQMIARRGERLGIRVHPHMFRHTFAHNWLDNGGAEGDLMELAGWDSPQMLRHYGRSARSARARRAYDRVDVMRGI